MKDSRHTAPENQPMSDLNGNGWNEWSRHVLKELERLNDSYERISGDVQELKTKVVNYNPEEVTTLKIQVQNLQSSDGDQETRLRDMENRIARASGSMEKLADLEKSITELEKREAKFAGKWAVLAMVGAAIISGIMGLIFKAIGAEKKELPPHGSGNAAIEKKLSAQEVATLRTPPK